MHEIDFSVEGFPVRPCVPSHASNRHLADEQGEHVPVLVRHPLLLRALAYPRKGLFAGVASVALGAGRGLAALSVLAFGQGERHRE